MVGSHLIATTAKLRNPKVPNVTMGVPIEYSAPPFVAFHSAMMLTLIICPGLEEGAFVFMIQSYTIYIRFVI